MVLADPTFIRIDPETDTQEMVALWQSLTGNTLYPAQVERLLINLLSYRENLVRAGIQYAGEQCLVNFATEERLDQLGAYLDVVRLPASAATSTVTFTRSSPGGSNLLIPVGTRVGVGNSVPFEVSISGVIPAGDLSVDCPVRCLIPGTIGNGFEPGSITTLIDPIPGVTLSVTNTTTTTDGADIENDENFRKRIKLAPNKFSVAGSVGAYKYWALSASQTIVDVGIVSPSRVTVNVYPLVQSGLPSEGIIDAVQAILDDEKIRPLTDIVNVLEPESVTYTLEAEIVLYADANYTTTYAASVAAGIAHQRYLAAGLGRDIIRSQFIKALSVEGVYSVNLIEPAADVVLTQAQWAANPGTLSVTVTGTTEG